MREHHRAAVCLWPIAGDQCQPVSIELRVMESRTGLFAACHLIAWIEGTGALSPTRVPGYAMRTYCGRPSSSIRFSTPTAMGGGATAPEVTSGDSAPGAAPEVTSKARGSGARPGVARRPNLRPGERAIAERLVSGLCDAAGR